MHATIVCLAAGPLRRVPLPAATLFAQLSGAKDQHGAARGARNRGKGEARGGSGHNAAAAAAAAAAARAARRAEAR